MRNYSRKLLFLLLAILIGGTFAFDLGLLGQTKNNTKPSNNTTPPKPAPTPAPKPVVVVDPLCSANNTLNGTCTVVNQTILVRSDFSYTTNNSLVFVNSTLQCFNTTPCTLNINLNNTALNISNSTSRLVLMRGSQLIGRQIIVFAPKSQVILLDNSTFNASAQSFATTGTQNNSGDNGYGASFVGEGGMCPDTPSIQTYSSYNLMPNYLNLTQSQNQVGSMGNSINNQTAGGGRIVLIAESLVMNGTVPQIQANAGPFANKNVSVIEPGGSGGYIYISTSNTRFNNSVGVQSTIQAQGGFGIGASFGGSGGIIIFDGNFTINQNQTSAAGGQSNTSPNRTDGCANGAAGTIWYRTPDQLYIDNKGILTSQKTVYTSPLTLNFSLPTSLPNVIIQGSARLQIANTQQQITFNTLKVNDSASIGIQSSSSVVFLKLGQYFYGSPQSTFDFTQISIVTINATDTLTPIQLGNVVYNRVFKVFGGILMIGGQVKIQDQANSTFKQASYFIVNAQQVILQQQASVRAGQILIEADDSVIAQQGVQISSYINNTCNQSPQNSGLFTCVPFGFMQNTTLNESTFLQQFNSRYSTNTTQFYQAILQLVTNYTVYVVAFNKISMNDALVQGSKIGFCAPDISLNQTVVNASGQGCPSGQGIGAGQSNSQCAGSGGSHGGISGYGISYQNNQQAQCNNLTSGPYFYPGEARYEGSGGGSGVANQSLGGSGGGIIWFSATNNIQLFGSKILANGSQGISSPTGQFGSGGGAGGSIQFITKNIAGDALINLRGADGSQYGGGGGSGGRLVVDFLQAYNKSNAASQSLNWSGTLDLAGGNNGQSYVSQNTTTTVNSTINQNTQANQTNTTSVVNNTISQNSSLNSNTTINKNTTVKTNTTVTTNSTVSSNTTVSQNSTMMNKTQNTTTTNGTAKANVTVVTNNSASFVQIQNYIKLQGTFEEQNQHKPLQQSLLSGKGQNGTSTSSKCFGGFSGPFCSPCAKGSFKFSFGTGVCQPCFNKPIFAYYDQVAQSDSNCSYQCNSDYEPVDVNPMCESSLIVQVRRVGGTKALLIILCGTLSLTLLVCFIIAIRSQCIRRYQVSAYKTVYDEVLFTPDADNPQEQAIGEHSLQIKDSEIWSHTYRMYLIGENSINYPWFVNQDFPNDALSNLNKDGLLQSIKRDQWTLDWTIVQKQTYYFFRLFFPYMADLVHRAIRRKHYRDLSRCFYHSFDEQHWEDRTGKTIRFTCDQNSSKLAYIDFLNFGLKKSAYSGPQLPLTLLLSGNGTMSTPYNFNFTQDSLAKSILYLDKQNLRTKLPPFFENLNTLLDKLSFYKFNRQTMKDLSDVIQWIEVGNKTIFNPLDTKLVLYLFENSYQKVEGRPSNEFHQRRRSMPLEQVVFEAFPEIFKNLIRFVQIKLLQHKSEIRFGIVLKPTTNFQRKRLQEKVNKLVQKEYGVPVKKQKKSFVSLLYDSDEETNFGQNSKTPKVQPYLKGQTQNLSGLDRKNINKSQDQYENDPELQEMLIHGELLGTQRKIIDRSKRAFDISVESSKLLEQALKKDKKKCKNCWVRFKSVFYSTYLMLFKANGRPPGDGQIKLHLQFLMFSLALSIEILLTAILILHVLSPAQNIKTVGLPFVFVLPLLTIIAPIWGIAAVCLGSATMLKSYSSMNSSMLIYNYPLTFLAMLYFGEKAFYILILLLLVLNKVKVSYFGAKVRQHFANPSYQKNEFNLDQKLTTMTIANSMKLTNQMSAAERAARLIASGKPSVVSSTSDANVTVESSSDDDDGFGIVSIQNLRGASSKPESSRGVNTTQGTTRPATLNRNPDSDDDY